MNFRCGLSSQHGRPHRMLTWTSEGISIGLRARLPDSHIVLCRTHANLSFRRASDQGRFYQDWGPGLCESRRRARSPICVPSNVDVNILHGLPCWLDNLRLKFTNQPSIMEFGWVDKVHCFSLSIWSAWQIGPVRFKSGLFQGFFHGRQWASRHLSRKILLTSP